MLLNFDVLFDVMLHVSSRRDASWLMQTCRTLYSVGAPTMLSFPVELRSKRHFISFHAFMSVGGGRRYQYLRKLTLGNGICGLTEEQMQQLIGLIHHATAIESLTIGHTSLLEEDLHFGYAIAQLTNVKEFFMDTVNKSKTPTSWELLLHIRSNVVSARLDLLLELDGIRQTRGDPIYLLQNLADSLEILDVRNADFATANIKYPHLKHLSVGLWHVAPIAPLIRAYPNLRTLVIHNLSFDLAEAIRRANREFQLQRTWEALDYVETTINAAYNLAISCKIHFLNVEEVDTPEDVTMLGSVLADCRPSILSLSWDLLLEVKQFPCLAKNIPRELEHLVLRMDLSTHSPDKMGETLVSLNFYLTLSSTSLNSFQDIVWKSLKTSKISKLEISLNWSDWAIDSGAPMYSLWRGGEKPTPLKQYVQGLNVKTLARRIISTIRSVQYLCLRISYEGQDQESGGYWRTNRQGCCLAIDRLDEALGKKVMFKKDRHFYMSSQYQSLMHC